MPPSWSNLHDNILDIIIHKLDIISFFRFSVVCQSWRKSSDTHSRTCIDKSTKTIPWLIFKGCPEFYSFSSRKTYSYPLRFPLFYKCFGSSNGFLLTTCRKGSNLYVVNPSTGVYFSFPCPVIDFSFPCPVINSHLDLRLHKAVITVSPYNASSDPKQVVMVAILSSNYQAAKSEIFFLKFDGTSNLDDAAWTCLETEQRGTSIVDIKFHKERLYATKKSGETLFFDLNAVPVGEPKWISGIPLEALLTDKRYFVESPKEDVLFMVVKRISIDINYLVFTYDESRDEWIEVKSLGNIALFVGRNSLSIFPDQLQCESSVIANDCIYYFDETEKGDDHDVLLEFNNGEKSEYPIVVIGRKKRKRENIFGDVFEFSMRNGSIKQLNASVQMSSSWNWKSPMWFLHSL